MDTLPQVLQILLPGGVAVVLTLAFNAVKSWRESKDKREETLLGRWYKELGRAEDTRRELAAELDFRERCEDYWRKRAAMLEFQLIRAGVDVPPAPPEPQRRERKEVNER